MGHRYNTTNHDRASRILRRFPKKLLLIVVVIVVIVLVIIAALVILLLAGAVGVIQSGDAANLIKDVTQTIQNIIKPITDLLNTLRIGG